MAVVINGSGAATQNLTQITFTPGVGGSYGGRYEGRAADVLTQMYALISAGYHVSYEQDSSPLARVTFDSPTNNSGGPPTNPNTDYTDNFQIFRNSVGKELLMSDHPFLGNLSAYNLSALKKLIQNPLEATYAAGDDMPLQFNGSGVDPDSANYLFQLFLSGVKTIEVKQPVLRVTRVTNPLYDTPFDVSTVDTLFLTASMISDSGVPANFAVPLVSLANQIASRTTLTPGGIALRSDDLTLSFGWLKDSITCETQGTSKIQYVLEYKFGLWDASMYGFPS